MTDLSEPADWYDVTYARLRHASDPAQDCDIDLNDTWRRWMGPQRTTRENIIQSVLNGAARLNATISKLNGRKSTTSATVPLITSIAVKFNGDTDEITRTENIESEGLVKHYDQQDRLVKIEFTRSGNSCTIQYHPVPVPTFVSQPRLVTWNNGYSYFVYKKGDTTQFTEIKPNGSVWDDLKFEETAR